ncbi:Bacitracin export ATP-binding protein BceA [Planctomycetes bacterium Poly30]|uniref:Bacitracin export ATP-binding protein BceA n=1 Tax=Saltatorellus ferox TaxID=2528018 RepID=A0A518EUU4_9BACT|nr:Bacitracin export ATP-binding protein BceA [Planctomycetes bacterium Poly30]
MSFIELRGVTRTYSRGEHEVTPLEEVDLDIEQGEFLVLLGPSGSGKTTLLNLLAGIDRPQAGTVTVGGLNVAATRAGKLARWRSATVGYVFQRANLVPVLTAYENVEMPLWLHRHSKSDRHARVSLALTAVGLGDRARHLPKQLSGGQEQRVAIARAIVADPDLIVADEPTGSLDAKSAEGILTLLRRLNEERGKTIVMVTHDPRAASFGKRVLHLEKGKLYPFEEPFEESARASQ